MRILQGVGHLACEFERQFHWELSLTLEPGSQRPLFHVRHDIVQESVGGARVEDRQDVGMGELSGQLDLAKEAVGTEGLTEFGLENLDRDLSLVLTVAGEHDHRHATPSELTLDGIAVSEGLLEVVQRIGHVYGR
jgi:hypothetical protein